MVAMTATRRGLLPVVCGGAAGALATLLVSATRTPEARAPILTASASVAECSAPPRAQDQAVLARLARLEAECRSAPAASSAETPTHDSQGEGPAPAEAREAQAARHALAIAAHRDEPIDPRWARETASAFEDDLAKIAARAHFTIERVDCRSASCLASVTFSRYADAQVGWGHLLHGDYRVACAREITLDEPADPTAPYQTTMVVDCTRSKNPR
jgi:hypothetical protein